MIRGYAFDEVNDSGKKTGFGDEWVKIGALKLVCDGSISRELLDYQSHTLVDLIIMV